MTTPRVRMVAGPNGSGKSTLFDELRTRGFALGHVLNPDAIERQLVEERRLDLSAWRMHTDEVTLREFVASHSLGGQVGRAVFSIKDDVLSVGPDFSPGYFTAVLADFMRRQW